MPRSPPCAGDLFCRRPCTSTRNTVPQVLACQRATLLTCTDSLLLPGPLCMLRWHALAHDAQVPAVACDQTDLTNVGLPPDV
eukprot:5192226-Amphidinium_carterae.1